MLTREPQWTKRKVKEALCIKKSAPSMNREQGYQLPPIYHQLLLPENGLYRKRRYMRRNQPKFGVYPGVERTIFCVFFRASRRVVDKLPLEVSVDLDRYMSTMSCLWDRTQNCGYLRFYLFENIVFVKSVAPITRLSYLPCLLIYITLCLDVTLDSARCSSLITLRVPVHKSSL